MVVERLKGLVLSVGSDVFCVLLLLGLGVVLVFVFLLCCGGVGVVLFRGCCFCGSGFCVCVGGVCLCCCLVGFFVLCFCFLGVLSCVRRLVAAVGWCG
ncbi:hypothetical protein ACTHS0_11490 [Neisseria sp. P0013.S009]